MQTIQGFITIADKINNTSNSVAEFFELSPMAMTYSRDRGEYQHIDYPGMTLHTFLAINTETKLTYALPLTQVDEAMAVIKAIVVYMDTAAFPYDATDLLNTLYAAFPTRITNIVMAPLISGATATFPEYISWTSVTHPDTSVTIWLRNQGFETLYSPYDIVVIPPFDQVDRFFGNYGAIADELAAMDITSITERIDVYKANDPYTVVRIKAYDYVNPNNPAQMQSAYWGALVYGKAGDNIDAIKAAIIAYIVKNSTHSQAEWEVIFPGIFKQTEFLMCPRWDLISIPNLTSLSALYSSISSPDKSIVFAKAFWSTMSASHIENSLEVIPFDYKAISLLALAGPNNSEGRQSLKSLFSDYIPVPTSSLDFNRMSLYTREWLLMMVEMIHLAETIDEYTPVPEPYRRITRNNVMYLSNIYDSVNYLVALRASVVE